MSIRVVLADDHVLVRLGLKSLLEREGFQVVGEASDGQEVLRHVESLQPDIAVVDIRMPILNGLNAARELKRSCPKTKVILRTQHDEDQYVSEAIEAGVMGYVLKNQVASDLLQAIQQVSRSQVHLSPGVSRAVMEAYRFKSGQPWIDLPYAKNNCFNGLRKANPRKTSRFCLASAKNNRNSSHQTHAEAGYS